MANQRVALAGVGMAARQTGRLSVGARAQCRIQLRVFVATKTRRVTSHKDALIVVVVDDRKKKKEVIKTH